MGIFSEITMAKPSDGTFHSGELVSGLIKYAVDEPTSLEKITISLKGIGYIHVVEQVRDKNNSQRSYGNSEVYMDMDEVIQNKKIVLPVGSYEKAFAFRLPQNIPSTFKFYHRDYNVQIMARIKYYVRIKFDKTGMFSFAKHFRKEIPVLSSITPRLSTEPTILGEQKKLTQPFSCRKSIVYIKANILDSMIPVGGTISFQYEVINDTNVTIKSVISRLMELHKFVISRPMLTYEDIEGTDAKTGALKPGESKSFDVQFSVPSYLVSLDHSKIISRQYQVVVTARMPMPHRDVNLVIPIQIGDAVVREDITEPPPSYWEAMGEVTKDDTVDDEPFEDRERKLNFKFEITMATPSDGTFHSGELVSGLIKYAVDEPTSLEQITISLKGIGYVKVVERSNQKDRRNRHTSSNEVYMDIDEVILKDKIVLQVGSYEKAFSFRLPQNIPSTFKFYHRHHRIKITSQIKYYVRIKFNKTGMFSFAKHFRKEILVVSSIVPKLSTDLILLGVQKTLTQPFSCRTSTVHIKANIMDAIIPVGGTVRFQYELINDTNVTVKSVTSRLAEIHTFVTRKSFTTYEDIEGTDGKTGALKPGETKSFDIQFRVPSHLTSLGHSKIISRQYQVVITARMPMHHKDVNLAIPIQIGDAVVREDITESPPSYWEAMGEVTKDDAVDDEPFEDRQRKLTFEM
ncbi:unnamed protein product [Chrysodeixis includens]|uniref:Arrestin C-terminal-like domain-containing protein n=1 Tax=Chrysodeixis includens TaxID=689277 RepID=A0A9N8KSM5_CHRIL|nr:unnamed protein product [Chrysodeixis includens]